MVFHSEYGHVDNKTFKTICKYADKEDKRKFKLEKKMMRKHPNLYAANKYSNIHNHYYNNNESNFVEETTTRTLNNDTVYYNEEPPLPTERVMHTPDEYFYSPPVQTLVQNPVTPEIVHQRYEYEEQPRVVVKHPQCIREVTHVQPEIVVQPPPVVKEVTHVHRPNIIVKPPPIIEEVKHVHQPNYIFQPPQIIQDVTHIHCPPQFHQPIIPLQRIYPTTNIPYW